MLILLLYAFPSIWMLIQSINRLFGRETFIFDKSKDCFIRNGFIVCSLREIQEVTAQVTNNGGQYPVFRLILELPQCQTVTLVKTHDVAGISEFHLSRNAFSNPSKRFAMFTPWLNYDEQNLIPFLPQEIVELRRRITSYIGNVR